ncbi:adaptin ear-binding coat-associated protein 2 isoform X2 [Neophocaena asiaeorientalis asiaeorientalis]|uniref:Adaptin ear-binding coat-associated protein 2 isoform X2 n=1 Tax=Neophocaena asiaeorientalis asiaeorientalis TaxID=1706337 RepID=A0A341BTK5_NEOAA|nr:adaptin ear-binding coat-associated protein 2 isoform X2 [Neophocaena asiaeorientalis asiaeorientalis]
MEEGEYESVLCVKPEVHVYRIPPRATNRGYRAAEWQLDQPSWSGRLRITAKGQVAYIKLEDRTSGELFAQAPVDQFPGTAVESVMDSSRYFVVRIEDGNGRRAFIGIGFGDRGDAFDFNVALQDHFKWVKQQCEFAKQAENPDQGPKLDLSFKEGQTIKLNIANMKKKEGAAGPPRARPASTGGLSLLPPPPGGKTSTLIPPPGEQLSVAASVVQPAVAPSSDLETSIGGATVSWPQPKPAAPATADIWGDFTKSTGYLKSPTPPYLTFPGRPPARLSQAQAGSSSDLSTTPFPHTTSGKELPHMGGRKEDEALPGQPLFGA